MPAQLGRPYGSTQYVCVLVCVAIHGGLVPPAASLGGEEASCATDAPSSSEDISGLPVPEWLAPALREQWRKGPSRVDRVVVADWSAFVDDMALLGRARRATSIVISDSDVRLTPRSAAELNRYPAARRLVLSGRGLDGSDANAIAGMSRVQALSVSMCGWSDTEVSVLGKMGALRELSLSYCTGLTGAGLTSLARAGRLQYLRIGGASLSTQGLRSLGGLKALRKLDVPLEGVSPYAADDELVGFLTGHDQLTAVMLPGERITDRGCAGLARHPTLQRLLLTSSRITGRGAAALASLGNLRDLTLANAQLGSEAVAKLSRLEKLEQLNLSGTHIGDRDLRWVGQLKALRVLRLNRTSVTGEGLPALMGLPKLVRIELRGTGLTARALRVLGKFPALQEVALRGMRGGGGKTPRLPGNGALIVDWADL